jgi:SAM-dependent methyltransferase
MTGDDLVYISEISEASFFRGPVLELGGGYGGLTCRQIVESKGLSYHATDLTAAPGVDFVANFESGEGLDIVIAAGPFSTVLVLNVLEHTFAPIAVLDNALQVLNKAGALVVLTPAVWPLHNFPIDCCRLMPDWYRRYALTRRLCLLENTFQYVGYGRVDAFRKADGQDQFPVPGFRKPMHRCYSRAIHKLFNTFGRGMAQPSHVAIACVLIRC